MMKITQDLINLSFSLAKQHKAQGEVEALYLLFTTAKGADGDQLDGGWFFTSEDGWVKLLEMWVKVDGTEMQNMLTQDVCDASSVVESLIQKAMSGSNQICYKVDLSDEEVELVKKPKPCLETPVWLEGVDDPDSLDIKQLLALRKSYQDQHPVEEDLEHIWINHLILS